MAPSVQTMALKHRRAGLWRRCIVGPERGAEGTAEQENGADDVVGPVEGDDGIFATEKGADGIVCAERGAEGAAGQESVPESGRRRASSAWSSTLWLGCSSAGESAVIDGRSRDQC